MDRGSNIFIPFFGCWTQITHSRLYLSYTVRCVSRQSPQQKKKFQYAGRSVCTNVLVALRTTKCANSARIQVKRQEAHISIHIHILSALRKSEISKKYILKLPQSIFHHSGVSASNPVSTYLLSCLKCTHFVTISFLMC